MEVTSFTYGRTRLGLQRVTVSLADLLESSPNISNISRGSDETRPQAEQVPPGYNMHTAKNWLVGEKQARGSCTAPGCGGSSQKRRTKVIRQGAC